MARPLRVEYAGAHYHITSRGNAKQAIFADEADRETLLGLVDSTVKQFGWAVYAYCLMGNHYHLLLETPEPNLVRGMRRLNGVYTQAFNRRHERVGHVLQGRYKAIVVDKDSHLLELCRYVVLNPVRSHMVKRPEDWPWSSYRATVGFSSAPAFPSTDLTLGLFGNAGVPLLRARFIAMIGAGVHDATLADRIRSNDRILGDRAFEEAVRSSTDSD